MAKNFRYAIYLIATNETGGYLRRGFNHYDFAVAFKNKMERLGFKVTMES